jgi:uroporphyrinogen decarboxylase
VSPELFKQFLLPRYRRVNDLLRAHGVSNIFVHVKGNLSALLPVFIEAGFTGLGPLECDAGLDPVKIRTEYGHDLQMMGGVDTRVLTQDKQAIKDELLYKIPDLIADGGYLPGLDQPASPDIPYANWLYYLELKRKLLAGEGGK